MIAPSAVRKFLSRPLADLSAVSDWSPARVLRELDRLDPAPRFTTKPFWHQAACFIPAVREAELMLLLEMGLGKSKIILDVFQYLSDCGRARRMLVLVPTLSAVESWKEQVEEHAPNLWLAALDRTCAGPLQRWQLLSNGPPLIIMTYAGALSLVCRREGNEPDGAAEAGRKYVLQRRWVRTLGKAFDVVVYDEITAVKNHRSLTFRMVRALRKLVAYRYGLTGTPFGRHPEDLWAEFFALDGGYALGATLGLYRAAFFTEHVNAWGVSKYTFKPKMMPQLNRMLAASSVRFMADDCLDLPKRVYVRRPIVFSPEGLSYYDALRVALRIAKGNLTELEGVFVRMRQLASGFLCKEVGGKKTYARLPNPKLDALVADIEALPQEERVVVFNDFVYSGAWIEERLKKRGISCARLYGGTRNKGTVLKAFKTGTARVLIANSQSGALALNLQAARYVSFYECPADPIIRAQAEKRCHRPGQKRSVIITDYFVKGSVEEKLLAYAREGRKLLRALLTGKEQV